MRRVNAPTVSLGHRELPPPQMLAHAREFAEAMGRRRTVRDFSERCRVPDIARKPLEEIAAFV